MLTLRPQKNIQGTFYLPGDKSISHRALIFSLLAHGTSKIENLNTGEDVATTASFLMSEGKGECGLPFINKTRNFDCRNSGTTLSLLLGILREKCVLSGDQSLSSRSFSHQIHVLKECGFQFKFFEKENSLPFEIRPPVTIEKFQHFSNTVKSAQLKTTLLLTALNYGQKILFKESISTRDHTERLLKAMGAKIEKEGDEIMLEPCSELKPLQLYIPGDVSLASFFITAVLLSENSHVTLKNMSLNPTRLIFINLLKQMGARINIVSEKLTPEPYGDVEISFSSISGGEVPPDMVGGLIDEIPCLALLGLVAEKGIRMRGAERLRNKETDRIAVLCYNLKNMGAHVVEFQDGFEVYPGMKNHSTLKIKSFQDHRMVMAFSLSAFLLKQDIHIDEPGWVKISYPNFFKDMFHDNYH